MRVCLKAGTSDWHDGVLTLRGRVADLFDAVRTDIIGYPPSPQPPAPPPEVPGR